MTLVVSGSNPEVVERASGVLRAGGVVALPTDTVYGIAASLEQPGALSSLVRIKGRPPDKPIPVLLDGLESLPLVARELPEAVRRFAQRFWPGALTLVVSARTGLPSEVVGSDGTVGVRVPDEKLTRRIIEAAGGALAVTSANRSGDEPGRSAAEVQAAIGDELELIVDGGASPKGMPSSVVRIDGDDLVCLRVGAIDPEGLRRVWLANRG